MTARQRTLALLLVTTIGTPAARAQDPKFEYGKNEEVKDLATVEYKASAQAGLIVSTGNSRAASLSAGATASRKAGDNKLSFEGAAAYARSSTLVAVDRNMNGLVEDGELDHVSSTTTKNWLVKLRYDRFFTASDSAYGSAHLGADEPAGKELFGGAQAGYSRRIFKDEHHELVGEIGYDLTYESYVSDSAAVLGIHSGRLFLGYDGKLSDVTGVQVSVEALLNFNSEDTSGQRIGVFEDTRGVGKASLTTKLAKRIDFRFAVTAKLDLAPAPLPPFAVAYFPGFRPLADELDVITEAALIVSFL